MINWVEWLLKGGRFAAKHQFKYDRGPIAKHQTRPCETPNQMVKHKNRKPQCKQSRAYRHWLMTLALQVWAIIKILISLVNNKIYSNAKETMIKT